MKSSKLFLAFNLGLLLVLSSTSVIMAAPETQDVPDPSSDTVQVVLVLDVSSSMDEPILYGDLPEELLALVDQIEAAEANPELVQIRDDIDAIWSDPEVVAARDAYRVTVADLDAWFLLEEYGENQEAIKAQIGDMLKEYNCDPSFSRSIATAITLDALDYWIEQACTAAAISFEQHQALRDLVPYLGDPTYTALQQLSDEAYEAYFKTLEARNYNDLIGLRDHLIAEANLEALNAELDEMIAEYGIPRKLDLAKLSAKALLGLSRLDRVAGRRESIVGLVRFSTDAVTLEHLTTNLDAVERQIEALEHIELTNIYAGLDHALIELEKNADQDKPIVIILLSDGHITAGPESEEVLEKIPPRAEEMDAVICTVGFGETEAHVDWPLLQGLADATDGEYLFAKSGEELLNFFIACRQSLVGDVEQIAGIVKPGTATEAEPLTVKRNVCEMSLALSYVSGGPVLDITDPGGMVVDENYADFTLQSEKNLLLYTILTPKDGDWGISVRSDDPGGEDVVYSIVITTNDCPPQTPTPELPPTQTPTPTPMPVSGYLDYASPVIPLVGFILLVLVIFIIIESRRRR